MARFASVLAAALDCGRALFCAAASADTTVWNFNIFGPPRAVTAGIEAMAEFYKKESNGSLEIKIAYGAALGPERQAPESIKSGGYEGGLMCAGYYPNKFPAADGDGASVPAAAVDIGDNAKVNQAILNHPADRQGDGRALEHQIFRPDLSSGIRVHGQQAHRIGRRHEGREDAHRRPQRQGAAGRSARCRRW